MKLTEESKIVNGVRVFRVMYTDGHLGGYVESLINIRGNARVLDDAVVMNKAYVSDDAIVKDKAIVSDNARIEDNAIVSDNARIGGKTVVCGNVYVGGDNVIERGYLHDRAMF